MYILRCVREQPKTGTLLFVLWGFLLLLSEVVLLAFAKRNLSRMIEVNLRQRIDDPNLPGMHRPVGGLLD